MANPLTKIRNAWATAEKVRAQYVDGFQVAFSHLGGAATTLWARSPDGAVDAGQDGGMLIENEYRAFRVARQTGFTGAVAENDELTVSTSGLDISGNVYVVDRWDTEHDGAVAVIMARRKAVRRANP